MTNKPDNALREKIKDVIAPNLHIDHQNIRPTAVGYTDVGVEYATDKLEALIQAECNRARLDEQERTGTMRYRPDNGGNYGEVYFYNDDGSTVKSQAERIAELQQLLKGSSNADQ